MILSIVCVVMMCNFGVVVMMLMVMHRVMMAVVMIV